MIKESRSRWIKEFSKNLDSKAFIDASKKLIQGNPKLIKRINHGSSQIVDAVATKDGVAARKIPILNNIEEKIDENKHLLEYAIEDRPRVLNVVRKMNDNGGILREYEDRINAWRDIQKEYPNMRLAKLLSKDNKRPVAYYEYVTGAHGGKMSGDDVRIMQEIRTKKYPNAGDTHQDNLITKENDQFATIVDFEPYGVKRHLMSSNPTPKDIRYSIIQAFKQ